MKRFEVSKGLFCVSAAVFACSDVASAQHLWTVDDDAPADFATIQDAIDAAANGDVLRVMPGIYAGFQISAKGVTVLGDSATPWQVNGRVKVNSTSAGQTVVVSGFTQVPAGGGGGLAGLAINACAGSVRIQDCAWMGQSASSARGGAGVRVENSSDVVLTNCNALGGTGGETSSGQVPFIFSTPYGGGHALESIASQFAVWGGNATAGLPGTSTTVYYLDGLEGGSGAYLDGSLFFASGTLLKGGKGGKHQLSPSNCVQANGAGSCGNAGAGLRFELATSSAFVQQPNIAIGTPGTSTCGGFYTPGHLVRPIVNHSTGSSSTRVPSVARTLSAPPYVAGTTVVNLTVLGAPGDLLYAVVENAPHFQFDAALNGVWSLSYPPQPAAIPDAVIPGSGNVTFPITLPAVPATQDARVDFVQIYVLDANSTAFVSSPRAVVIAH